MIHQLVRKAFIFISLFFFFLFICCAPKEKWQTSTLIYFDTVCEVKLHCFPSEFNSYQKEVRRVFSEIEIHFSPGARDFSSPIVLSLYHKALNIYYDSNGCFDITIGSLSRIWGFLNKSFRIPSKEEIEVVLNFIGMDKIKEEEGVLILEPSIELDWGGIAKGLGIDLAQQSLKSMGIKRGFINAGGDLFCWGKNPENDTWKIGINHPRENGYIGILAISGVAAATTGDYQRFFKIDGIRYHHIFNPQTGYPAKGKQSVTVIGPKTLICDALSTALFVSENPEKILKKYPNYGAIIVDSEGKVFMFGREYLFRFI